MLDTAAGRGWARLGQWLRMLWLAPSSFVAHTAGPSGAVRGQSQWADQSQQPEVSQRAVRDAAKQQRMAPWQSGRAYKVAGGSSAHISLTYSRCLQPGRARVSRLATLLARLPACLILCLLTTEHTGTRRAGWPSF